LQGKASARRASSRDQPVLATLAHWLRYAEQRFRRARLAFGHGTDNAYDEAAWLLLHVAGHPYDDLAGALPRALTAPQRRRALALIEKRIATRKPLAHLLREAWLGEHRFYVDERVIVPRSHIAELLRDGLAPWIRSPAQVRRALDMCTGSGCLAILLALSYPRASIDAVDVSASALAVARRNVDQYRLRSRVHLVRSDLFAGLANVRYDVIVANPPYVNARAMRRLPQEFRREPPLALAGGRDGLAFVRRILLDARRHLTPHGILVVEIGNNRRALERAYPGLPFTWLETSTGGDYVFLLTGADLNGMRGRPAARGVPGEISRSLQDGK
jgi:ribosomal protein L3 glutamine methyltransferase